MNVTNTKLKTGNTR